MTAPWPSFASAKRTRPPSRPQAGDYWRGTSNGYVFTTGWGEPIYPDTAFSLMTKLIRAHNHPKSGPRPKMSFHDRKGR